MVFKHDIADGFALAPSIRRETKRPFPDATFHPILEADLNQTPGDEDATTLSVFNTFTKMYEPVIRKHTSGDPVKRIYIGAYHNFITVGQESIKQWTWTDLSRVRRCMINAIVSIDVHSL